MAALYERRTGPRKVALEPALAPATPGIRCCPRLQAVGPAHDRFVRSNADPGPLPANDADIAFAPVTQLSRWIEQRKLTSERLTQHLSRSHRAVRSQAALRHHAHARPRARAGEDRPTRKSPPASIAARCTAFPGAQRICSTPPDIPTTYGAEPFRNRVPAQRRRRRPAPATTPAPCSSPSSASARSRSTTSGSAARP